ncbi:DoxX family protein [Spirosoma fluminis]
MIDQQPYSRTIHNMLWVAQVSLAASLVWAAGMKLVQPVDKLSAMWPWVGQVPAALVKFTGLVDLLGAIGLILPSLVRIKPKLTPIAAIGIIVLMLCASIFHIGRGEASGIGVNIVFAIIAAFVAWGRLRKVPIAAKQT